MSVAKRSLSSEPKTCWTAYSLEIFHPLLSRRLSGRCLLTFPPDALLQLKQRNGERKLAAATALAKLEATAEGADLMTPPVVGKKGVKRVVEEGDQPTKMSKICASSDTLGLRSATALEYL